MSQSSFVFSLLNWLRKLGRRHPQPARPKRSERGARPAVEMLEDRLAPASLTDAGGSLTITLDIPGETLTISGKGSNQYSVSSTQAIFNTGLAGATFSSGTLTLTSNSDINNSINIVDAVPGTSVDFAVGSGDFSQQINVNLSSPLAGGVSFTGSGTMTFAGGLSVTTQAGSITSTANTTAIDVSSGDLSLTADEGAITLNGIVTVASGATTLDALGAITANGSNDFGGGLNLGGRNGSSGTGAASANVDSTSAVQLTSVNVAGALTVTVTAAGAITESEAITVGGAASFTTTSGAITLSDDNNFGGDVSAFVNTSGADDVTIDYYNSDYYYTASTLEIGTIKMGTGLLTLSNTSYAYDYNQNVEEDPLGGGIITGGDVDIELGYGNQNVLLGNLANSIAGTVTVNADNYYDYYYAGDFALANTAYTTSPINNLSFNGFYINSLTLDLPNATIGTADWDSLISLPAANYAYNYDPNIFEDAQAPEFDNLTLTAKSIAEDPAAYYDANQYTYYEAVTVTGDASFTATSGNITLGNTYNDFQGANGAISAAVTGTNNTNNIQIDNSDATFTIGTISLQNGSLTLDDEDASGTSTIAEGAGGTISTGPTSTGTITVNIASDTKVGVDLSSASTDIAATVAVDVNGAAAGTEGNFGFGSDASANNSLNQVSFTNFKIDDLTLVFSNASDNVDIGALYSGTLPLSSGIQNDYANLAVTVGGNITDSTALTVTGTAAFTAGGNISQTAAIIGDGDDTFNVTGATSTITLTNSSNAIGTLSVSAPATGSGAVTLWDNGNNGTVYLGDCTFGTGQFTVTALGSADIDEVGGATISQAPTSTKSAVFDVSGTGASIDLSLGTGNFFAVTPTFSEGTNNLNSIAVEDANPAAKVPDFIAAAQANTTLNGADFAGGTLTVILDAPAASVLLSTATIGFSLTVTATNNIVLPSGSTNSPDLITVSGSNRLTLTSESGDINLFGQLAVGGTTTLTTKSDSAAANNIIANDANNAFGTLDLISDSSEGGTITIVSANTLTLGDSTIDSASLTATADAGSILQAVATSITDSGPSDFITANGAVNLDGGNYFSGPVSASTDTTITNGNGAITLTNSDSDTIILGSIDPQLGNVTITAPAGISESAAFGGIVCSPGSTATLSFTVTGSNAGVDLSAAPNNIPSTATVSITGSSTTEDLGFRNVNAAATMAQVQLNSFTVQNLTVEFDNASINFNTAAGYAFANTGDLTLTAGGNIGQSSAIVTSGTVTLGLEDNGSGNGDGSIILDNASNDITGSVYFSAPDADNKQQISLFNTAGITLDGGNIGLAGFTMMADGGSITQATHSGLTQGAGGGPITLEATGNTINLVGSHNDFTGPVVFNGGIDDVQTVTTTAASFTLTFKTHTTASIAASATPAAVQTALANLADIGAGNVQVSGVPGNYVVAFIGTLGDASQTAMTATGANVTPTITGAAGAGLAAIGFDNTDDLATLPKLIHADAVFTGVTYDMPNAPIALPSIDTGTLNVTAGANIAQQSSTALIVTGEATFTTGNYGIQLINSGNNINEISLDNSGENAVSVATTGALIIDSSFLGSGALNITAGGAITETSGDGIEETLGTNDALAGVASFTVTAAGDPILLDSADNEILGPINLTTSGTTGHVTIVNDAATTLGADSVGGDFSVEASDGGLSQAAGTSFSVGGNAYFSAESGITLANPGSSIVGTIGVSATADTTLVLAGAVTLADASVTGFLGITASGAIGGAGAVVNAEGGSFTSGTGSITLTNAANNFNDDPLALSAPAGAVFLTDSDTNGLLLGQIVFGSGGLTVNAAGDIIELNTVTGSGSVTFTNSTASPITLTMTNPANDITGTGSFALSNFGNVSIANSGGNIELTGGSTLADTAQVTLVAGGIVDLPNGVSNTLTLGNLSVSAHQTNVDVNLVATDVVVGGGGNAISFTGAVDFMGPVTLDASADVTKTDITFNGNVSTSGPITVDLPDDGELILAGGDWMEGAGNNLTINGPSVTVDVQAGATMSIAAGDSVFMTGEPQGGGTPSTGNSLDVEGTLQIGGAVTLSDAGTDSILTVNVSGTLLDLLAATPSDPTAAPGDITLSGLNPSDQVNVLSTAQLSGYGVGVGGLAPSTSEPIVQITGGGIISGVGANPANNLGEFLMGTDIVTATQTPTSVSIQQATTGEISSVGGTATFIGNEPDGDKVTVTAIQTGDAFTLMPIFVGPLGTDPMAVVVRGDTANNAAPITLTITTTPNGGDGFTLISGIAIDGNTTAADTITASLSNIEDGNIITSGPLAALTLHNWNGGLLQAGNSATVQTTITGNIFDSVDMNLGTANVVAGGGPDTVLSKLTLAADLGAPTIMASSFGTITVNGNAAANQPGNFTANLVSTNLTPPGGVALTSATIASTLTGNWELAGSIGTVTVGTKTAPGATTNWALGVPNGPGVADAGLLTNVTTLTLGTVTDSTIFAAGNVTTLTAISVNDAVTEFDPGTLQANSFGTITTTGATVTLSTGAVSSDHGNFVANITATGNVGGATKDALGALSVAGDLGAGTPPITLLFLDGNVGAITVGELVNCANVDVVTGTGVGNVGTVTAGAWEGSAFNANNVTTWTIKGNLPAQLFGYFQDNTVTLTGTMGAFSTTGGAGNNTFTVEGGSVTSFTIGGTMSSTFVTLTSTAATTALGTITAGEWYDDGVTARTIGTLKSLGRPAAAAATPALDGDITNTTITAFEPAGLATPGIGTFSAAGEVSNGSPGSNYIIANNGITTFTVGRDVSNVQLSADLNGGTGGIGTLSVGAWSASDLAAYSIGTFKVTAYATPELTTALVPGDVTDSDFIINGSSTATHNGINAMTVQHNLGDSSAGIFFNVPFGIGTLSVVGTILGPSSDNSVIDARNPLAPASGMIGTITAGEIQNVNIYADEVSGKTGIDVTGSAALGLNGDFDDSTLAVAGFTGTASAPIGVTAFTLAGNLGASSVEVADGITTFTVAQSVNNSGVAVAFDPVNLNAALKTLTVGAVLNDTLIAGSIGTFSVTGNANFGLGGNLADSAVTITGNLAGFALGTFTATGHVQDAVIHVTSGNVNSFKTAYLVGSGLYIGYTIVDPTNISADATNNGQTANWEGIFTLGSFTTTAVPNNSNNNIYLPSTAGFEASDVVAAKLGTVVISGLEPNLANPADGFGFGFRTTGGLAASTFTVAGATEHAPSSTDQFVYIGLGG